MNNRRLVLAGGVGMLATIASMGLRAQDFPSRSIKLLIGYPAGGGMDGIGRVVAKNIGETLGQSIVVENRPGATGMIAAEAVAAAPADGYTLLLAETGLLIAPSLQSKTSIHPINSFTPVGNLCVLPLTFALSNDFPGRTLEEFVAALKKSPNQYSYGSPGVGTVQHLAFEQFIRAIDAKVVHVPYKGGSTMIPDLIAGRIKIGILSSSAAVANARAGNIRVVAVTSAQRVSNLPEVPTVAELLPGFDAAPRLFLVGPKGVPTAVVDTLAKAARQTLQQPVVQESFLNQGAIVSPPLKEEFSSYLTAEMNRWQKLATDVGIKAQ